ncbi:MarR family winged helix-turn-helix transcriptional regulator [Oceanicella sp. SM1341]|uniref:MarR family winged helix-turn-helix transcriptional regulator n=1 Tax=Oceanicella sp. SM1341 TaxID=1548889 RepID=UPI001E40ADC7|nr:MarR family transcriptional regulator [Oceanicella sp. SM1341]
MTTDADQNDAARLAPEADAAPLPAPEQEPPLSPGFTDDYLLYLLAAASARASAEFHTLVAAHGLRVPEWRILACLASREGLKVTELAHQTLFDQPRLTKTLNVMERAGLVLRRSDPSDRRLALVSLTPEGRARVEPLLSLARGHEAQVLSRFPAADRRRLKAFLVALAR